MSAILNSAHTHASDEVARALDSDVERGLSSEEAEQRLQKHGPNVLRAKPPTSAWRRWLAQFQDPLVYLLLVAVVIALVAWQFEGGHGWPVDALVIGLVISVNAVLGYLQQAKAESAVAALARMTEVTSTVLRAGSLQRVASAALVPGDLLVLAEGDAVGADARLLRATALRVQEASLTGESEAVLKDAATLSGPASLGDRLDMVFKGTAVVQGSGRALVTATGMATEMGSIAELLEATEEGPTPLQQEVGRIGRVLGLAVVIIAVVVVGTVLLLSEIRGVSDVVTVLLLGVSLAVAAVPEGLPAVLSVVLALGVQRMARRNAIVKKLSSVETLGSASVICSDKTGTLTRSEMMIERVMTASGGTRVTGVGYVPEGRVEHEGRALTPGPLHAEHVVVLSGGSLAGNADLRQAAGGEWLIQGDPTEAAFLVAERKLGASERRERRFERVEEIPFSSERKMMSTIERDREQGGALVVISKGAPDLLIERCTRARVGTSVVPLADTLRARALSDVQQLLDESLRTLSVAYRPLDPGEDPRSGELLERDLIFVGTVGMIDPPRLEVAPAIREARRAGIRVVMITGDHPRTATRIAADLGIIDADGVALTGAELDALDAAGLAEAVRRTAVYARVAPVHKLRIVEALQANGEVVAMTGDGVNDAPALKAADIGIAMGITGTEVSKEAAKMILADDNFATIVAAVREGRDIFDDIQKFLRYLLSSNMGEVLTVFLGVVFADAIGLRGAGRTLVLPLLATQILWINLITDSAPALAMGVDPETEDVMARPPRRSSARAIDLRMWVGVLSTGLVMALATLLSIDLYLPGGWLPGSESLATGRTVGFTVLVLAQLFNCFNARSETASAFRGLFRNRWLWSAVGLSLLLQVAVVHVGVLNVAFSTVPLSVQTWAACVAMASSVLWFSELRKWIFRRLG
ncbi:MAG: cation-translocating P-type ATPase [Deltaproteobacteria bacterium]